MQLKCKREGCGWTWDYRGKKHYPAYVSCPNCLGRVLLPKEEVEVDDEERNDGDN